MTLIVFEDAGFKNLLPLTYWRTTCELRTGYGRLVDFITAQTGVALGGLWCRDVLAEVTAGRFGVPVNQKGTGGALLVNGRLLPTTPVRPSPVPAVQWEGDVPLVIQADDATLERLSPETMLDPALTRKALTGLPEHRFFESPRVMRYSWDLVHVNTPMLEFGWEQAGRPATIEGRICEGVYFLNKSAIHIGRGSVIKPGVVLDAEQGPIYIGENVTIAPNTSIEGPCYIGDDSLIQPGSALRHGMSIGRRCKAGGELESSIIHGFSNKQHDGFLGHAYVAEWVNLAADTINSDLKNTYGTIRVPVNGIEVESGQMFVGLTIGDHSKTGIGQLFPTGAVVGFGCNVATCEFSPRFVPSFTWLTGGGATRYDVERCLEVARRVMARRQIVISPAEEKLFRTTAELAAQYEVPLAVR
jgi:UDP-N-acetylglucosamine diphosphorylase/glucosamine-1-phosphate N-acetyltransferase